MALRGKIALVTGAQQGIGRGIVLALAAAGADVAINYLDNPVAADAVAAEAREQGVRAMTVRGDVARPDEARMMVEKTTESLGRLDILVNNAGMFPRVRFLDMTEADWDFVLDINLKGSFLCAQAAARSMVAANRQGAIINLASSAVRGIVLGAHYTASKGGIVAMTRAIALELAPHGIRVNAIAPGLIDTAQPRYGHTEDELMRMGQAIPLGRIGQPADVADVAVFLASDNARFVTGQTIYVNGGAYMP